MTERSSKPKRKPRTAWEPGYCPNPAGRPKGSTNKAKKPQVGEAELRKILKDLKTLQPKAFEAVKDMLETSTKVEDKYKAAIWVLQQIVVVQRELSKKSSGENDFSETSDEDENEEFTPEQEVEEHPLATLSLKAPSSVN